MAIIEYHRRMLGDAIRNDALTAALKKTVKPGDTVIDIGAGTGFLAMIARNLGAGHCICIERDADAAALSREIIKENGIKSCTVMEAHSTDVRGLPKADVVISETLGNFAYEENIIETLRDAHRFLKPGGKMIPKSVTQYVVPVIKSRLWDELASWNRIGKEFRWQPALQRSMNNMYVKTIRPEEIVAEGVQPWDSVDFSKPKNESVRSGHALWTAAEPTTVYGLASFWECLLAPGISLSTSPLSPLTHWEQIFLPFAEPVSLAGGDTLSVNITSDSRPEVKINVTWEARHKKIGGAEVTQSMDMKKGY